MTSEVGPIFELYVDDDRYEVPTLRFSVATGEAHAREMARQLLAENPHHRGVELRANDRRICGFGTFATPCPEPERTRPTFFGIPRLACGGTG